MGALKVLTDEAKRLRKGGRPVEWGWCHRLHAFLFVFEEQNRFVLEWPHYGNATYFFNLESRDVDFQLQRLIAVMSIGTVTKNDIVEDRPLEVSWEWSILFQVCCYGFCQAAMPIADGRCERNGKSWPLEVSGERSAFVLLLVPLGGDWRWSSEEVES